MGLGHPDWHRPVHVDLLIRVLIEALQPQAQQKRQKRTSPNCYIFKGFSSDQGRGEGGQSPAQDLEFAAGSAPSPPTSLPWNTGGEGSGSGWTAVGCEKCAGTGYHGRQLLVELLTIDANLRQAILARADTTTLEEIAHESGRITLWTQADEALRQGWTTAQEIERVLGPR